MKFREFVKNPAACIPVAVLRFALFVPFGIYVGLAEKHWNVISAHPELHAGIYDLSIPPGEKFARKWGRFTYIWNFAVWFPGMLIPAPFSLPFTLIDISAAVLMSVATSHQTAYSPHEINTCRGTGAHDWRLPAGANESFFDASARLNATATTSFQMCKTYVQEWQYGVSLSFFYCLLALFQLAVCYLALVFHYTDSKRQGQSFWKPLVEALVIVPKMIVLVTVALVYYIPVIFFRCLPLSIKGRVRYARRYAVKTGIGAADKGEVQLEKLSRKVKARSQANKRYRGTGDGEPTGLADFLGIYDMLMLVVEDLHYADIVNLSLASKSVREAVLPAEDYKRRIQHFKMYTCDDGHKTQCWVCSNQICSSCTYTRSFRRIRPYFHLDNCTPYCKSCYKEFTRTTKTDPPVCKCAPKDIFPAFWIRVSNIARAAAELSPLPLVDREVCRECVGIPEADIMKIREERTGKELKGHVREGGECALCKSELGRGPRWWICGKCRLECTAACHEAWGKKSGVGEAAVGDGAV